MKKLLDSYMSVSLVLRIIIGLIIGVLLALVLPNGVNSAVFVSNEALAGTAVGTVICSIGNIVVTLGDVFVGALKAIAPLLVVFLIISSLASAKSASNMKTVIPLYIISTVVAGVIAVCASYAFPTELVFGGVEAAEDAASAPAALGTVIYTVVMNAFANPIEAIVNTNYLGVLFWSCLLGIALRYSNDTTKSFLNDISSGLVTVVRWIINFAPFGIAGLIYEAVTTTGLNVFTVYGHLVLVLVGCMLVAALITNPLIVFLAARTNPYPLVFRCLRESAITAFFTRSSAANIPVNMDLCDRLGLDRDSYSLSIPLGATINMAGACITISVLTMATAHTLGIEVGFGAAIVLCVLSAISACGASGVPGGSLLLIPLACSLFGIDPAISAEVVGIGFIIAVIQDSCETALNSSSDALFTATAELRLRRKLGLSLDLPISKDDSTALALARIRKEEYADAVVDNKPAN